MITSAQMRLLENLSEQFGVSKQQLMENAGRGLYDFIKEKYGLKTKVLVICGQGNNGGDGFVLARLLPDVAVLFVGDSKRFKRESMFAFRQLIKKKPNIIVQDLNIIQKADLIVDAMLGTGIEGRLREPYSTVVDQVNVSGKPVISVDIPTGVDPDTGRVEDKAIEPTHICTFHDIKQGLESFSDKTIIIDIGIPSDIVL